jgi:hypothetical protein
MLHDELASMIGHPRGYSDDPITDDRITPREFLKEATSSYYKMIRNKIPIEWYVFKATFIIAVTFNYSDFLEILHFVKFNSPERETLYLLSLWANIDTLHIERILSWGTHPGTSVEVFKNLCLETKKVVRDRMIRVAPCFSTLQFLLCGKRYGFPRDVCLMIAHRVYDTRDDTALWIGGIPEEFRE